jgi:hypothetical protein
MIEPKLKIPSCHHLLQASGLDLSNHRKTLKETLEIEVKKRKNEFKKRYEYYIKIKKGLKMLDMKIVDKTKKLTQLKQKRHISQK